MISYVKLNWVTSTSRLVKKPGKIHYAFEHENNRTLTPIIHPRLFFTIAELPLVRGDHPNTAPAILLS